MRFTRLQGIVCQRSPRIIGFPRCVAATVSGLGDALCFSNRPPALSSRVHSLVRPALFGVFSPSFLALLRSAVLPWGFFPLRGVTGGVHCSRDFPLSRFVPSSGFLNLSTACSTFGFAGFFHPAATSRVSVQGFGPDPEPCRFVTGRASLPLSRTHSPVARLPHVHD